MTPIRLLITSRDVGAAYNILPVAQKALLSKKFRVTIVAAKPAYDVFIKNKLPANEFESSSFDGVNKTNKKRLLFEAGEVIRKYSPDAILLGYSGPDANIDEAIVVAAKKIPTFLYQDYWGDINTIFNKTANTIFVMDDYAIKLTNQKLSRERINDVSMIKVGYPKYVNYSEKYNNCDKILISEQQNYIAFIGQPYWQYTEYKEALSLFVSVINTHFKNMKIMYCPHPRETSKNILNVINVLGKYDYIPKIIKFDIDNMEIENIALFVTINSNASLDLVFSNKYSQKILPAVLYWMPVEKLTKKINKCGSQALHPLSQNGYCKVVTVFEDAYELFKICMSDKYKYKNKYKASKMPSPGNSISMILSSIKSVLYNYRETRY